MGRLRFVFGVEMVVTVLDSCVEEKFMCELRVLAGGVTVEERAGRDKGRSARGEDGPSACPGITESDTLGIVGEDCCPR
ncbi:MAG: hypothetical protein R3324_09155 [Halobacteriales archaeon]|nr:hypothetical protein [Halobacteriales archaeon]